MVIYPLEVACGGVSLGRTEPPDPSGAKRNLWTTRPAQPQSAPKGDSLPDPRLGLASLKVIISDLGGVPSLIIAKSTLLLSDGGHSLERVAKPPLKFKCFSGGYQPTDLARRVSGFPGSLESLGGTDLATLRLHRG